MIWNRIKKGSSRTPMLRWLLACAFLLLVCALLFAVFWDLAPNAPLTSTAQLPEPVSDHVVEVLNGSSPGSVEIRALGTVDLNSELFVERQLDDGSFEPLRGPTNTMRLITFCGQPVGSCVRIDERGLRPVPWSGFSCIWQCPPEACGKNSWWGGGRFRFVVKSCDGKSRFEGQVFKLPNRPPDSVFHHLRASRNSRRINNRFPFDAPIF